MPARDAAPVELLAALAAALADLGVRWYLLRLDLDTIRSTLTLLEQALAQSDLVPAFERELTRARR